jgi:hypothetical protein
VAAAVNFEFQNFHAEFFHDTFDPPLLSHDTIPATTTNNNNNNNTPQCTAANQHWMDA